MENKTELEVSNRGIVQLATNLDGIKKGVEEFNKLKNSLLQDHTMDIKGHKYVKKSGWRIVALAFNLSDKIVSKEYKELGNGEYVVTYTVEVTAPNGRTAQGIGSCSTLEKTRDGEKRFHNAESHAHTRAKNRAISDLVGLGELSAEEIDENDPEPTPTTFCTCTDGAKTMLNGKCKICNNYSKVWWEQSHPKK